MLYPSIDEILEKVPSKFLLANAASRRSAQLSEKKDYLLLNYKSKRNLGRAIEEIYFNKIHGKREFLC